MTSNFSPEEEKKLKKLFDVWSKPLENKILRLEYKLRKTENELYKLKDSLVYRNMAASRR
jgi:hypothetical protein